MKRQISVYLDAASAARQRRLVEREGRSHTQIIRAAIALYDEQKPDRTFLLTASWHGDGRSVADTPEDEMMRGFGEESLPEDIRSIR
jgi:hypothetical protein